MVFALISLGCPKNQVDADVMCRRLLAAGHTTTADLSEADMILVNTCGFIDSAKSEAIENILMACEYKKQNPALKVVVTGCLAQRYQSQIADEIPEVDGVVGLGSSEAIVSILERIAGGEKVESYGPKTALPLGGERVVSTPRHYAYLKIAEGCNNCCHYCAIPSIRGPLRSRTVEDCVAEARWLAAQGVKELILVAQDVTAFGDDRGENEICRLLDALQPLEGIEWIRMLYAYPERITDEFIAAMVRNSKVLHYIDIPIQHSVTRVLKSMNRKGDEGTIRSAVSRLRAAMPDITLRTTLIAGYPGETEEEFEQLQQFVREMKFDRLGCFAYSQEEGTVAARMENQLDEDTKQQRADSIMRIQTGIMAEKQAAMVGRILRVLCDGLDEESGLYLCRSAGDAPDIDGAVCVRSEEPLYPGEFYTVLVEQSDEYDLFAVPVNEEEEK